jgi:ribonuclease HI
MKTIEIYTDGSALNNPGKGGWGAVLIYKDKIKKISGHQEHATNNQMEIKAAIEAIKTIKEKCKITLHTDSNYLKMGITTWIKNWQKNNWIGSNKKPVKNIELWKELDVLNQNHEIQWKWVKAHDGNLYNEMADELAKNSAILAISDN